MKQSALTGPLVNVKLGNASDVSVNIPSQLQLSPSHLTQSSDSRSAKSIKREPTLVPLAKQEWALSYPVPGSSDQRSHAPTGKGLATDRASVVAPVRLLKKRSRSPEAPKVLAGVPDAEGYHGKKRVRVEDGSHHPASPSKKTQSLKPPNNVQAQNKNRKDKKHKNCNKKQKRNQNKRNNKNQNKGLVQSAGKQKKSKPFNSMLKAGDMADPSRVLRTEVEATPKMPKAQSVFVPRGNVYITRNCKRLTLESGRTFWEVDDLKKKGIRVPKDVYDAVIRNEEATRDQRKAAIDKVDKKEKDEARKCLLALFPNMPLGEDSVVLGRAWERSSGRVGRTSKLTLEQKVRKAVVAHVRHMHTSYDKRLREESIKNGRKRVGDSILQKVRSETWKEVNVVVNSWKQRGGTSIINPQDVNKEGNGKEKGKRNLTGEKQPRREKDKKGKGKKTCEEGERHGGDHGRGRRRLGDGEGCVLEGRQWELARKELEGGGKAQLVEIIVIDSDSDSDSGNGSKTSIPRNPEEIILDIDEEIDVVDSNTGSEGEGAEDWDISEDEDEDFFYAEESDDEDYIDTDEEYPVKTHRTRNTQ